MTTCEIVGIDNYQELYKRVKKDPNAVVMDVGEKDPFIIHQADYVCTMVDGSEMNRTVYATFEYVKRHLRDFKDCSCETCQNIVAAYRLNKKTMRGATPREVEALVPSDWIREQ